MIRPTQVKHPGTALHVAHPLVGFKALALGVRLHTHQCVFHCLCCCNNCHLQLIAVIYIDPVHHNVRSVYRV